MKISSVIPAFNADKYLERAVNSLIGTRYPELEIIIVDDGSSDGTWEVARRLQSAHPEVRALQHPDGKNHGVSAARNRGLIECTGELICFLDADDYVFPYRFEVASALLISNPEIDAVHELAVMKFEGERGKQRFWDADDLFGIRTVGNGESVISLLLRGGCWPTSGILFRKSVLRKTGLFPETYKFAEDYHLWLRMAGVANVVSGETEKPVSVYSRHDANVYQGGLVRKVDMIRAMTEVHRWLRKRPDRRINPKAYAEKVCDYVRNALIRTREESRLDIGRSILRMILANRFFPALCDDQLLRQAAWVLAGRAAAPAYRSIS